MADTTITFTIPESKVQRVIDALKGMYPIPTTDDGEGNVTNDFTDAQWAKESVRRWVVKTVSRFEESEAKKAVDISEDDSIIS